MNCVGINYTGHLIKLVISPTAFEITWKIELIKQLPQNYFSYEIPNDLFLFYVRN